MILSKLQIFLTKPNDKYEVILPNACHGTFVPLNYQLPLRQVIKFSKPYKKTEHVD